MLYKFQKSFAALLFMFRHYYLGVEKMSILGRLIREKRDSERLSLREFADLCNLSHSYIKNLEQSDPRTGKKIVPTLDSLEKLAPVLGMSLEELLKTSELVKDNKKFEPSNLVLIRAGKTYEEISENIMQSTGNRIDPNLYESLEKGKVESPSLLFIDILANYAGVNRSFFYKVNTVQSLSETQKSSPYPISRKEMYHADKSLHDFLHDPSSHEYLILAKELKEKKIKVQLIRQMLFYE